MVCWARVAFPTLAHADLALGMDGICLLPYLNEVPPMSKGRILVQRYPNPDMMSYPNRMATMFQSIFNCLPNLCFRTPFWCMTFCAQCNYPSVAWMPATSYVAGVDEGQRAASLQAQPPPQLSHLTSLAPPPTPCLIALPSLVSPARQLRRGLGVPHWPRGHLGVS